MSVAPFPQLQQRLGEPSPMLFGNPAHRAKSAEVGESAEQRGLHCLPYHQMGGHDHSRHLLGSI